LHARNDPYWVVIRCDKFKGNVEKNPDLLAEVFKTRRDLIMTIFDIIASSVATDFSPHQRS